ncbi:hypothetical protein F2Q68_00015952 [Brassica cretica]|uniref:Uncharacterized protein n=1 Tax=Brassica cretica TaxID=69181 RepID=A0A8S9HF58_BRACR|nr:hypothetical protein F2Q68_00015952 [Brassica cretica]
MQSLFVTISLNEKGSCGGSFVTPRLRDPREISANFSGFYICLFLFRLLLADVVLLGSLSLWMLESRVTSPLGGGPMPLKVSFGDYPYTTASSFAL